MRKLIAITAAAAALAIVAGVTNASAATENPRDAAAAWIQEARLGQWGRMWAGLHPVYQRAISRSWWEHCKRQSDGQNLAPLVKTKVIDDYPDTLSFPLLGRMHVRAVTVEFRLGKITSGDTSYFSLVDGHWRWLFEPDNFRAYRAHRCAR